jgi:glycosyltransferase involved in cell wall biosynthesis
MGKYSYELLRSIEGLVGGHLFDLVLVFNSNRPLEKDRQDLIESMLPSAKLEFLDLSISNSLKDFADCAEKNKAQIDKLCAKYIAETEVSFMIVSLFEGEWVSCFPSIKASKFLIYYDMIPYIYHKHYLNIPEQKDFYLCKYKTVFEADIIFTISNTTREDLRLYMGIQDHKIVNIDGARIPRAELKEKDPKVVSRNRKYILFPSGDDFRKNNDRAVQAYKKFKNETSSDVSFVITSTFTDESKTRLKAIDDSIIFSGNVDESELLWLYKNAEFILFTPEYEGLGLPVLEAVELGKKVVCSDIAVFREISMSAFSMFDPKSVESITNALVQAYNERVFDVNEYKRIDNRYTWFNTATTFLEAIEGFSSKTISNEKRPKIAIIGPDPTGYSGVSKVLESAHFEISEKAEVTYFLESTEVGQVRPSFLPYAADCRDIFDFNPTLAKSFDYIIYHIGNSDNHLVIAKHALRIQGVVVLHDLSLEGLYGELLEKKLINRQRYDLELALNEKQKNSYAPFSGSVTSFSQKTVVHSKYAKSKISKLIIENTPSNIKNIDLPLNTQSHYIPKKASKYLKIGLAGNISDSKGIELLIKLTDNELFRSCNFIVFGYDYATNKDMLNSLRKNKKVTFETNLTDFEYNERISSLDILFAYRSNYHGETSYTVLEGMRAGVPVLVRDIGWFKELPDETVLKAKTEVEAIELLQEILGNAEIRKNIGERAMDYVALTHNPSKYSNQLLNFISTNN